MFGKAKDKNDKTKTGDQGKPPDDKKPPEEPPSKFKKGDVVAQTRISHSGKEYNVGDVIPKAEQGKLNTKRLLASKKIKIY